MIVIDASAVIEFLLATPGGHVVERLLGRDEAAAPELMDAEAFHQLVRLEKRGQLSAGDADTRIADLTGAPIVRIGHDVLLGAARRYTAAVSGYDALHIALAAMLDATFITADAGLGRTTTEQFGVPVTTVPTSGR